MMLAKPIAVDVRMSVMHDMAMWEGVIVLLESVVEELFCFDCSSCCVFHTSSSLKARWIQS